MSIFLKRDVFLESGDNNFFARVQGNQAFWANDLPKEPVQE
jgi:hypothetical protein